MAKVKIVIAMPAIAATPSRMSNDTPNAAKPSAGSVDTSGASSRSGMVSAKSAQDNAITVRNGPSVKAVSLVPSQLSAFLPYGSSHLSAFFKRSAGTARLAITRGSQSDCRPSSIWHAVRNTMAPKVVGSVGTLSMGVIAIKPTARIIGAKDRGPKRLTTSSTDTSVPWLRAHNASSDKMSSPREWGLGKPTIGSHVFIESTVARSIFTATRCSKNQ